MVAPAAADTGLVGATCTVTQHGGRIAQRRLTASTALVGDSDWPGLQQAAAPGTAGARQAHRRTAAAGGRRRRHLAAPGARHPRAAARALAWPLGIENQLHDIRDVAFDEDRATARAGHAPQVMAAFRNLAISLLHALGTTAITATCRRFMARPSAALLAIGLLPDLE